jgi:hypothetical protein
MFIYQHKKDRPKSTRRLNVADDVIVTGGIDVRLLSNLTFGKQRGVKKHELRLKVRSMPITVPDAIADLSMAICKSIYRMILGGLDEPAIVEYIPNVVHGNAQHTTIPYRSLTSHQKSILRDGIQHGN